MSAHQTAINSAVLAFFGRILVAKGIGAAEPSTVAVRSCRGGNVARRRMDAYGRVPNWPQGIPKSHYSCHNVPLEARQRQFDALGREHRWCSCQGRRCCWNGGPETREGREFGMDGTRFDDLTRMIGSGLNRRQVLRGLIGGAGALAVTGCTRQFARRRRAGTAIRMRTPLLAQRGVQPGNDRESGRECCTGNGTVARTTVSTGSVSTSSQFASMWSAGIAPNSHAVTGSPAPKGTTPASSRSVKPSARFAKSMRTAAMACFCDEGLCAIEGCLEEWRRLRDPGSAATASCASKVSVFRCRGNGRDLRNLRKLLRRPHLRRRLLRPPGRLRRLR